jgi:dTDP-glucose pyrophosphorylase
MGGPSEHLGVTGIVLAAGEGHRMGPLGQTVPKVCLPVGNRPLIASHLAMLEAMGVRRVVVVVGHLAGAVAASIGAFRPAGMVVELVEQPVRRGIADALARTRPLVGAHLVVVLGDTHIVPGDLGAGLRRLVEDPTGRLAAILSVRHEADPDRIRRECTVRFDGDDLVEIEEKPAVPFNDLKPCGLYFFSEAVFAAIEETPPSSLRGEVEITDAIQTLIRSGWSVGRCSAVRWDTNLNTPDDLLAANVAEVSGRGIESIVDPSAVVDPSARLSRVVVGARARVAAGADLTDSLVLPDAEVGPGTDRSTIFAPGIRIAVADPPQPAGVSD